MSLRAFLLFNALLLHRVLGNTIQRIIDDQLGDLVTGQQVQYSPGWAQGNDCGYCAAKPSPASASNGTWHDVSWNPGQDPLRTMSIRFTGTAIQVFLIGVKSMLTDVQFTLDDTPVGSFTSSFLDGDRFVYGVSALHKDDIPNGEHILQMQSAGDQSVLILFDYALYSLNDNVVTTSSTVPDSSGPVQVASASSNSPFPVSPVTHASISTPVASVDPLRPPDSSLISASPSSISTTVPDPSGSLTEKSQLSASQGSRSAGGSSPGSIIAQSIGAAGPNPTTSPQSTSTDSPSGTSLSNREVNVGAIVGGVIGGLVLLLAVILLAILYFRRQRDLPPKIELPREQPQPHIIPFRVSIVEGRNGLSRTRTPSPSPSLEKQRSAVELGTSTAVLPSADRVPASVQLPTGNLRAEMGVPHAHEATSNSALLSATGAPQSRNAEIVMPRKDKAIRFREKHGRGHLSGRSATSSPAMNEDVVRQLASLRAEMEEMRLRQDIPSYGELPGYTPQSTE
ncbi:hypothetical protein NLI96_g7260 [Meripilus lineatus]|uniref:Mid2 domain-containing protein n=1 Tax=Meripilus lineatus TaxID=2056292 RepID=A0AAD5UZT9_9APHY|nr:hypothetical protein NLI96_g7260 [Physisporinus lineatus]